MLPLVLPDTVDWTLTLGLGEKYIILELSGKTKEISCQILLSSGVLGQDRFMFVSQ